MYVKHISEIEEKKAEEGAKNTTVQWLIDEKTGASNFAMRKFTLKEDGNTPYHSHDWEHEVYILSGEGTVKIGDEEGTVKKDNVVFIPPNVKHCFKNGGSDGHWDRIRLGWGESYGEEVVQDCCCE